MKHIKKIEPSRLEFYCVKSFFRENHGACFLTLHKMSNFHIAVFVCFMLSVAPYAHVQLCVWSKTFQFSIQTLSFNFYSNCHLTYHFLNHRSISQPTLNGFSYFF